MSHLASPSKSAAASARRRLLRGSMSVPVVMTVASGSALAAASNTCLQRLVNDPAAPKFVPVSATTDSYLRVPVYKNPNNGAQFVKGADVEAVSAQFDHFVDPWLKSPKWFRLSDGHVREFNGMVQPVFDNRYIAVRIEEAGTVDATRFKITGVATSEAGPGVVATTGCIGSLMPMA